MTAKKRHSILTLFLILIVCINLFNVRVALADGEAPPTEPPAATEVATEAPTEATSVAAESISDRVEATATPVAEALNQIPESTEVVVLNENGDSVPLATQEAAAIAQATDPMWCPEGVAPGGPGCTTSFTSISLLINNMVNPTHTASYAQNGVIYFTANPGSGLLDISELNLGGTAFNTLKNYNLTLTGGWNGDTVSPSFSGQTDFGNSHVVIGSSVNPWIGNVTLNDLAFCNNSSTCSFISQTALTVYTTTGNIALNNVDVTNQANGKNTALLNSTSGDITVTNGTYDGNNSNSAGFFAATGSGSLTISNSDFKENKKPGPANTFDGVTISAPTVTLNNVTSTNNDGNGITINNANLVTLNNVLASVNGTDITPVGFSGNIGSGVIVNGNAGSRLIIIGGTFNDNQRYGVEIGNPANTDIYIQSNPTCTGNDSNVAPINNCYNDSTIFDNTPPTLFLPSNITTQATDASGAVVNYSASATDIVDSSVSASCSPVSGSAFGLGTTMVHCFSSDKAGHATLGSFQVTVQAKPPVTIPAADVAVDSPNSASRANSSTLIIPLTGGEIINLDCDSAFWAFGIKLSFINLCNQQTILNAIDVNNLPGQLPNGLTFVMGLNLNILSQNQILGDLPNGTGVQISFPISGSSVDPYEVLHWNGNEWIQISQQINNDQLTHVLGMNAEDEFYQVQDATSGFYQILTTGKTGSFVLVKK